MPLFILTETSAGYALLKSKDKKLLKSDKLGPDADPAQICSLLRFKKFTKFDSAAAALEEAAAIVEGKVTPTLSSLLDTIKDEAKASLAVADPKLASAIHKLPQLSIVPISDSSTNDLFRSIREHLPSLLPGLMPDQIKTMSLGLSHSLSRHKLKFSPDKVDTMVVQAIALLDDLDKELNVYAMRVKEWYGWHFPEMARIINDNLAYAKVILAMGMRTNASKADLSEVLPEEIEQAVKAAAEISMGTEITADDLDNIQALAQQVADFTDYRQQLSQYLSARMAAIAPNLTALVGDLVGARLIAHAGSLMNLSKSPASTIQILGAEKALFRALKTKHNTPKYGIIFHASLVGQATGRNKAKIARVLAAKAAIGLRVDALADWGIEGEDPDHEPSEERKAELGTAARIKIERQLARLEGKPIRSKGVAIGPNGASAQPSKWEVKEARKYNRDADGLIGNEPAAGPSKTKKIEDVTPITKSDDTKDISMADANNEDDSEEVDGLREEAKQDQDEEGDGEKDDNAKDAVRRDKDMEVDDDDDVDDDKDGSEDELEEKEPEVLPFVIDMNPKVPVSAHPISNGTTQDEANVDEVKADEAGETSPPKKSKKERKKEEKRQPHPRINDPTIIAQAQHIGISTTKYLRKLEQDEIKFDKNGNPYYAPKRERQAEKRAEKKARKAQKLEDQEKKRKEKRLRKAAKKEKQQQERSAELKEKKRKRVEEAVGIGERVDKKRKQSAE